MTVQRDTAPALVQHRIVVLFSADFLAAFANVALAGAPRIERHDGKEMIAVPATVTAPLGAFTNEERVDVGVEIVEGRAIYARGLQRRARRELDT